MALLIFIVIISIVLVSVMLYFFNKGESTIENEEFDDFLLTISDLDTFLTIILVIVVPIGAFIIIRVFKR